MFTLQDNRSFDQILQARRICRGFTDQVPAREDIEAVIEAGRLASYASSLREGYLNHNIRPSLK